MSDTLTKEAPAGTPEGAIKTEKSLRSKECAMDWNVVLLTVIVVVGSCTWPLRVNTSDSLADPS